LLPAPAFGAPALSAAGAVGVVLGCPMIRFPALVRVRSVLDWNV
jgi:hypothetical protein